VIALRDTRSGVLVSVPEELAANLPADFVPVEDAAAEAPSGEEGAGADEASDGAPPRSGPGSGREAWVTWATELGIDVPVGATREDIFAAVDALTGTTETTSN
jgi:hypothetical protein